MHFYLLVLLLIFVGGTSFYQTYMVQKLTDDVAVVKKTLNQLRTSKALSLVQNTEQPVINSSSMKIALVAPAQEEPVLNLDIGASPYFKYADKIDLMLQGKTVAAALEELERGFFEETESDRPNDAVAIEHAIERIFLDELRVLNSPNVHCKTNTCKIVYETDLAFEDSSRMEEMEFLAALSKVFGGSLDVKYGARDSNRATLYMALSTAR